MQNIFPSVPHIRLSTLLLLGSVLVVAACGGGSVSSSGGGNTSAGDASSTVLVRLSNFPDTALHSTPQNGTAPLVLALSDLLIRQASAATAGVPIYFNGRLVATTDADGAAVIAIAPGSYTICFGDGVEQVCTGPVDVPEDSLVFIDNVNVDTAAGITHSTPKVEMAEDYLVDYQDPNNAGKTLVCHKDKFTISVGTPAAQAGHMAHDDYLGECANAPSASESTASATTTDNVGNNGNPSNQGNKGGNNGNNGNRGNNGNNGNGNNGNQRPS